MEKINEEGKIVICFDADTTGKEFLEFGENLKAITKAKPYIIDIKVVPPKQIELSKQEVKTEVEEEEVKAPEEVKPEIPKIQVIQEKAMGFGALGRQLGIIQD